MAAPRASQQWKGPTLQDAARLVICLRMFSNAMNHAIARSADERLTGNSDIQVWETGDRDAIRVRKAV